MPSSNRPSNQQHFKGVFVVAWVSFSTTVRRPCSIHPPSQFGSKLLRCLSHFSSKRELKVEADAGTEALCRPRDKSRPRGHCVTSAVYGTSLGLSLLIPAQGRPHPPNSLATRSECNPALQECSLLSTHGLPPILPDHTFAWHLLP